MHCQSSTALRERIIITISTREPMIAGCILLPPEESGALGSVLRRMPAFCAQPRIIRYPHHHCHYRHRHYHHHYYHHHHCCHLVWKSEGWVNIYNVKMSKTEMACAPPKTCQNQKSFWDPSTYHPNTTGVGWMYRWWYAESPWHPTDIPKTPPRHSQYIP